MYLKSLQHFNLSEAARSLEANLGILLTQFGNIREENQSRKSKSILNYFLIDAGADVARDTGLDLMVLFSWFKLMNSQ